METYEEKYKDLVKRLNKARVENGVYTFNSVLDAVAPELKIEESEDERMMRVIMNALTKVPYSELDGLVPDTIRIWLERKLQQGEQKPVVNDNAKEMFIKALERVEEQNNKGYKLTDCDKNSWWEDFKAYTSCTIEQKHAAWSDEDEKQARQIERIVHDDGCTQKLQKQIADWFKSLKDRYTWKPSERQMATLEYYMHTLLSNEHKEVLFGLYNYLKKLREEQI